VSGPPAPRAPCAAREDGFRRPRRRLSWRRWAILGAALILLLLVVLPPAGCGETAATLEQPVVEGGVIRGRESSGVWSYLGVPYAAPPVGDLRWKPPQAVIPWKQVRVCDEYGPSCPQRTGLMQIGLLSVGHTSEDCLYLNVWTPAESPKDRLPVMVWIHGGSFTGGSASMPLYSGETLARRGGVVVVGINYRLGPFGFLAHPALSAESPRGISGNYGLLDQMAALTWVKENIGVFGGDATRVTVFGESAGAISVLHLMASPLAQGLFQRAIAQSGVLWEGGLGSITGTTLGDAERAGREFVERLGLSGASVMEGMRALTSDQLLAGTGAAQNPLSLGLSFGPVVDGHVLPDTATRVLAATKQMDVPLLIGSNADEGELFLSAVGQLTPDQYREYVRDLLVESASAVLALYPADTKEEVSKALSRMVTEMGFAATARFAAICMNYPGIKSPAYLYQFTRVPTEAIRLPGVPQGAFHGLEIPYVFGKADTFGVQNPVDHSLSEEMIGMWTRFAATGNPNKPGSDFWPTYDRSADRYLELGDTIVVKSGLYKQACDLADVIRVAK